MSHSAASTTSDHTPCLEIAVYDVHAAEADGFPARQAAMHAALAARPGFVRSERLRGLSTPTLFADYITWASRAEAEAAAAQMPSMPDAAAFMAAIETIRTFTHLPVTSPPTDTDGR
jgi:heme-degrading monooxygenase HmoA